MHPTIHPANNRFDTLESDEALILVRGPWISMALFSLSLSAFGHRWRLGQASSDEFTLQSASSARAGHCSLFFQSLCKMGPALSSLRAASSNHPRLEILLGYQDPFDGLEMHLFIDGRAQALDKEDYYLGLATSSESLDLWVQTDLACHDALLSGAAIDPSWLSILDELDPTSMRQAMILIAGQDGADPKAWPTWTASLGDCWSWTRSPWTAAPPWRTDPHVRWLDDLARMASQRTLKDHAQHAAATKAVLMTDQMARVDLNQARDAVALALPLIFQSDTKLWTSALSKSGRNNACTAFALALAQARVPLRTLFSTADFASLAARHPINAGQLLLCAPLGYDVDEMEWLGARCPPEISSFFERQLLHDKTPPGHDHGRDRAGRL